MTAPRLIVGITGASGAAYGIAALRALKAAGVETHLVISKTANITIAHETELTVGDVQKLANVVHKEADLAAAISSGSFKTLGMLVAPCSMRSLAEIAHGASSNLLTRAADVILKERRKLVLLVRETPLTNAHLRNMLAVSEMGGIIAPPVPAFYSKPANIEAIVNHTVGRALDLFDLPHELVTRWAGLTEK